ncbi:MAG: DnaA/Hda family protein, partial [Aquificota bacterium]|nr:DnaA/Hda family protein [Aquificota bacterium]
MGGTRINTFIDLVKNRDRTLLKILRHLKIAEKDGRIFLTVPDPDKREYVENLIRLKLGDSLAGEVVVVSEEKNRETSPDLHTGLSRRFTFDNFIVGEGSRLAYEVAVAVSENPGSTYNPFFLYGRVGIGKTHLLQAIGNRCLDKGLKGGVQVRSRIFRGGGEVYQRRKDIRVQKHVQGGGCT